LRTGVDIVHIPYKGGGPAVTDTLGGQVQLLFVSMPAVWQHVKAGKVKAIAVTSAKRSLTAPDVPTIAESGVADVVVDSWYGLFAPAKTLASDHRATQCGNGERSWRTRKSRKSCSRRAPKRRRRRRPSSIG
jgi:tripartite-type tricarboxylate transporter receptor subunit TctC